MKLKAGVVLLVFFTVCCSRPVYETKLEKEAAGLLDKVENSSIDLKHVLDQMAKVSHYNTVRRNKITVATIESSIEALEKAESETQAYLKYVERNRSRLIQQKLFLYVVVGDVLGTELSEIRAATKQYLRSFKRWLQYCCDNYDAIVGRDPLHVNTYEHLLAEHNYARIRYKSVDMKYRDFVNEFARSHPDLAKKFASRYKRIKKEMGW